MKIIAEDEQTFGLTFIKFIIECFKVWSIWFPREKKVLSKFRRYYNKL